MDFSAILAVNSDFPEWEMGRSDRDSMVCLRGRAFVVWLDFCNFASEMQVYAEADKGT